MNFDILNTIIQETEKYHEYIPKFLVAFLLAFLITPFVGLVAKKYKFIDVPKQKRNALDKNAVKMMHKTIMPRLGGLAVILALFLSIMIFDSVPKDVYGILIGIFILTIIGSLDDKFNLSGKTQILFQIIAASIVIIFGVSIIDVNFAGHIVHFDSYVSTINLGSLVYSFTFPADLITLAWILFVTNAFAWLGGIDALAESISFIATLTFAGICVGISPEYAVLFFIFAGSLMGFIPYNFPTAKLIGGSAGHINYGFFLSTMVIASGISGINSLTIIIILSMPIIDMIWVLIGRLKRNNIKSPLDLLSISDKTHFHHRIIDLGFSVKETLYIEMTIFSTFCLFAFYLGRRNTAIIILSSVVVSTLIIFGIIGLLYKRNWRKRKNKVPSTKRPPIQYEDTPEQKYAY